MIENYLVENSLGMDGLWRMWMKISLKIVLGWIMAFEEYGWKLVENSFGMDNLSKIMAKH